MSGATGAYTMSCHKGYLPKNENLRRTWKSLENVNKVAMEVQENTRKQMRNDTITRRRRVTESDDPLAEKRREKADLEFVCDAVKKLSNAFSRVERYGHDVPCIRPVRELCGKLKLQLNNEYSTFNRTIRSIRENEVPAHRRIADCAESLCEAVNNIAYDESEYIAKLEDIKQYLGELLGIVETVLQLEYNRL